MRILRIIKFFEDFVQKYCCFGLLSSKKADKIWDSKGLIYLKTRLLHDLLLYVTLILLYYLFYADMPIIHCLLVSEMYNCNF